MGQYFSRRITRLGQATLALDVAFTSLTQRNCQAHRIRSLRAAHHYLAKGKKGGRFAVRT